MTRLLIVLFFISTLSALGQGDKTIKLEKIIFHTSRCRGKCPVYHLQVDSARQIQLLAQYVSLKKSNANDSSKTGYFVGIVSDSLYDKMTNIIQQIGIDSLVVNHEMVYDGVNIGIIIYYNGKRKSFSTRSPQKKLLELIHVLYDICEKSELKRTDKKFDIEH